MYKICQLQFKWTKFQDFIENETWNEVNAVNTRKDRYINMGTQGNNNVWIIEITEN